MSICQCLRVVERSCKSQFVWRGTTRVPAAVYEFLLRDMAIRPLIDGVTELDPDEPAVPVTGLAFLCLAALDLPCSFVFGNDKHAENIQANP